LIICLKESGISSFKEVLLSSKTRFPYLSFNSSHNVEFEFGSASIFEEDKLISIFIGLSGCIVIFFNIAFFNHSTAKLKFKDFDAIVEVLKVPDQTQDLISIKESRFFPYIFGIFK
jgi:hypothetical protein